MKNPTGPAALPPVVDDVVVIPWAELSVRGLVPPTPSAGPGELTADVAEFCRANKVTVRQADNLGPGLVPSDVARLELARRQASIDVGVERADWDAFVESYHRYRSAAVREAAGRARADMEKQARTTLQISEMDIRQAEENAREAARADLGPLPGRDEWHTAGRPIAFAEWKAGASRRRRPAPTGEPQGRTFVVTGDRR